MNLYILRAVEGAEPWDPWYDKAFGFVVRAESEQHARRLAAAAAGDEGKKAWTDSSLSTCKLLTDTGDAEVVIAEVVLRDFASG